MLDTQFVDVIINMLLENEHSITCIHSIYNNEQARFFRNNGLECTVWEEKKEIA